MFKRFRLECRIDRMNSGTLIVKRCMVVLILALSAAHAGGAQARKEFQVVGRILQGDGKPFRRALPVVFLQGTHSPFHSQASVGLDGQYKFKKIPPGIYTLSAAAPHLGEMRRTIEVGPSFADSKGKVTADITFDRIISWENKGTVSAVELSVPDNAKDAYRKAQDRLARRDIPGAVAHLKKAVELAPQFAVALNQLGTIAYQSGQFRQAEVYFREALKQDPELYAPLVNLGGALLSLQREEDALAVNLSAVKTMPGDALAHAQLGRNYYYLGKLEDAETHLKRAATLDPSHFSLPQITLIEIYLRRKQFQDAVREMENVLKLHPDADWAPNVRKVLEAARARISTKP